MVSESAEGVISELLAAHDEVVEAMYNNDLEAAWRNPLERWHEAERRAQAYLEHSGYPERRSAVD